MIPRSIPAGRLRHLSVGARPAPDQAGGFHRRGPDFQEIAAAWGSVWRFLEQQLDEAENHREVIAEIVNILSGKRNRGVWHGERADYA